MPHSFWPIWSGGEPITTLYVLTNHCVWGSCSHESEVANWRRNATGTVRLRWQLAEPPDDGWRARCSLAPCRRLPLESDDRQVQLHCPGVAWVVKVTAEEVADGASPREDSLFDLHNDEKTGPK
jgi:hypothetical protein